MIYKDNFVLTNLVKSVNLCVPIACETYNLLTQVQISNEISVIKCFKLMFSVKEHSFLWNKFIEKRKEKNKHFNYKNRNMVSNSRHHCDHLRSNAVVHAGSHMTTSVEDEFVIS